MSEGRYKFASFSSGGSSRSGDYEKVRTDTEDEMNEDTGLTQSWSEPIDGVLRPPRMNERAARKAGCCP